MLIQGVFLNKTSIFSIYRGVHLWEFLGHQVHLPVSAQCQILNHRYHNPFCDRYLKLNEPPPPPSPSRSPQMVWTHSFTPWQPTSESSHGFLYFYPIPNLKSQVPLEIPFVMGIPKIRVSLLPPTYRSPQMVWTHSHRPCVHEPESTIHHSPPRCQ